MSYEKIMPSVTIDTKNVYKDLETISKTNNVDIKNIDFNLISIITYYKTSSNDNFAEIEEEDLIIFDDDSFLENPDLVIVQEYRVKFFDQRSIIPQKLPDITLGINKHMTKVIGNIKDFINIKYSKTLKDEILNLIYKKLIKAGILVGIRNEQMIKELDKLISILRIKGNIDKEFSFVVTTGIEPIFPINDSMIYNYKNKSNESSPNGEKVDYASRGFIQSVSKDEVILEYLKPQIGKHGRNVRGELIKVLEPKNNSKVEIKITDNIEVKEDEKSIKYIAKKNGYISNSGNSYDIKDELDINEVSFKTTGSIEAGLNTDVKIHVKEKDVLKDAVGAGMNIETSEIKVEGNIAKGANIHAIDVVIGGTTHAKSTIEATKATIGVHIGRLICEEARIGRLEGGYIKAQKVYLDSVIGGEIIADEIYIKKLFSNSNITASKIVEIEELKGTNNKITIDASLATSNKKKIEEYGKKIILLEKEISNMPKELEKKKSIIDSNKDSVNSIKNKIKELRTNNITPPIVLVNKLKDFQSLVYKYNLELQIYESKQNSLQDLHNELKNIQSSIFNAKIINKDRWKELNEIKFKLIEPVKEITYSTRENELARLITLKYVSMGLEESYEIKIQNELKK